MQKKESPTLRPINPATLWKGSMQERMHLHLGV